MGMGIVDSLANALAAEIYNNNLPFISNQPVAMNPFGASALPPFYTRHLATQQQIPNIFQSMTGNGPYNQSSHQAMNSGQFSGNGFQFAQPFADPTTGFRSQPSTSTPSGLVPSAASQSQSNDPEQDSEFEEEYFDPDTGRPLRGFLDHEKAFLRIFYTLKHPSSPISSEHAARVWQISMSSCLLDEWNNFLLSKQSKREAADRADSVKEYQEMIIALKNRERAKARSKKRGNEFEKPGRKRGTKNKPKASTPVKGARISKRATPKRIASALKTKRSFNQQSSGEYCTANSSNFSFLEISLKGINTY